MNDIIVEVLAKFNFDRAAEVADLLGLYTIEKDELIETATGVLNTLLSNEDTTYVEFGYFRASYDGNTGVKLEFIPLSVIGCKETGE